MVRSLSNDRRKKISIKPATNPEADVFELQSVLESTQGSLVEMTIGIRKRICQHPVERLRLAAP